MKKRIPLIGIAIAILCSFNTSTQAQDSTYYNRLFYTCKAWGHVKYYHTETANGNVDWDKELENALSGIKDATDNDSFNQALLQLLTSAGEMGTSSNPLPTIPDSLNNNSDYSWMQAPIFSADNSDLMETIRTRFRPQSNVYVDQAWAGGNPTFFSDDSYYLLSDFPTEERRTLALFRYWNIINYFFPYKDLMDQNWDTTLVEFIPLILEASDALSYNLAFKRLTSRINDSHAYFVSPTFSNWVGYHYTPFLVRFIENEMVITKVLPQITEVKVGDIIKEIDGEDIYKLRDSLRQYAHGSNEVVIERELNLFILRGEEGSFPITVDDGNNIRTETLIRNSSNRADLLFDANPAWKDTVSSEGCTFGIVDMGKLEVEQINSMFLDLWETDALIFDIRNYPNNTLWTLVDYLFPSSIDMANFTVPDITYPGRLEWLPLRLGNGISDPYPGKLIILFDERTQSQAEYTVMGLEQFPGAIKIGSTTSGADGNVSEIFLPGKIRTFASFLGVFYPDGTPTQRIGILPDYEVLPTIAGIRAGEDEVMDFALNCDLVDTKEVANSLSIKLYPNPVTDEIRYELGDQQAILLELFDMQGRKVKMINTDLSVGNIDLSALKQGIYTLKIYTEEGTGTQMIIKL